MVIAEYYLRRRQEAFDTLGAFKHRQVKLPAMNILSKSFLTWRPSMDATFGAAFGSVNRLSCRFVPVH
ncbi:MAG: hypothetical protein ACUVQ2_08365, partial [Dissulfurimicrobium sp.]|uniref:hypothetical protein n=1 Tax=Dissulfurimicrobium sp. TaxID=2022436 RepID=UPI004048F9A1